MGALGILGENRVLLICDFSDLLGMFELPVPLAKVIGSLEMVSVKEKIVTSIKIAQVATLGVYLLLTTILL